MHLPHDYVINTENVQRTCKCQQEVKEGDKNDCPNQEMVSPTGDHEKCLETYEKISREN